MNDRTEPASTREAVLDEMRRVGAQQGKSMPPLEDDLLLLDSGLDSLCIAILVATLDDRLGIDPFSGDGPTAFPVTVGDFVSAYEHAAA
jgi:acyl carrier protein